MIKFSVITCTYNASAVLARTLDSVLSQSWTQIEHIIIDGASKDNTLAMAQAYSLKNQEEEIEHEVVIISEPDRGLYDAMNKGLARATGDYIVYLNAGDVFPSDQTLEQISIEVNNRSDGKLPAVLYGDTNIVDDEGRLLHPRRLVPPENLTWRSFRHGMLVCHQAFYARTDLARKFRYNCHYRFSADFDWCVRILREAERKQLPTANLHAVAADYLNEGMTTKNHKASLRERFRIMCHHYGLLPTLTLHAWFALRSFTKK